VRASNEDQFLVAELTKALRLQQSSVPHASTQYSQERGHLFLVADGMGGHAGGERASALAVQSVEESVLNTIKWFFDLRGPEGDTVIQEFQEALRQADARLLDEVSRHPELRGMGTTLTLAYHLGSALFIVHVGDSRCYLLRRGDLLCLTQDHTLVAEWARQGVLSPEEAEHHRLRHVIVNVVGGREAGVEVEVHKLGLEAGDRILLCTDGLTEMVPHEEIAAMLNATPDSRAACERLVAAANERGGRDNITAVVARFGAAEERQRGANQG
jgi:protein phosphatase